jgi:hypothetical protein
MRVYERKVKGAKTTRQTKEILLGKEWTYRNR